MFEGSGMLQEITVKLLDFAEGFGSASEIVQDIKSFAEEKFIDGRIEGRDEGYRDGHSHGYDEGWESGYWHGKGETTEDCTC